MNHNFSDEVGQFLEEHAKITKFVSPFPASGLRQRIGRVPVESFEVEAPGGGPVVMRKT